MKQYLSYFKLQLLTGLQYRTAALAGISTQFFWGFLYCMVYQAFYSHTSIDSMSFKELISYVWLNQALFSLVVLRMKDNEVLESIRNGTVAYELCRPYKLYYWWYIKILSKRYASVMLRSFPILIFAFLLPEPFRLDVPISVSSGILFIVSLLLGSLIVVGLSMIIHSISFFTLESKGISSIVCTISELLSGVAIPVPLLPNILIKLTYYLPFRLIGDTPFRIYSGNIGINEAISTIFLQVIWIILLIIIGRIIISKALKKVCIQGG